MDVQKPKTKTRLRKRHAAAAIGTLAVATLLYATAWVPRTETGRSIELVVEQGSIVASIQALGTIKPRSLIHIAAETDGRVIHLYKQPGARVRAREPLLQLEDPQLQSDLFSAKIRLAQATNAVAIAREEAAVSISQAKARVVRAETDVKQATADLEARRRVFEQGVVSRMQVDEASAKALIAHADLSAAREAYAAQRRLNEARIQSQLAQATIQKEEYDRVQRKLDAQEVRAPSAGTVSEFGVEVGERVTLGQALGTFAADDGFILRLRIPEAEASIVKPGAKVVVEFPSGPAEASVSTVAPKVDDGYVRVDVVLPNGVRPMPAIDTTVRATVFGAAAANATFVELPQDFSPSKDDKCEVVDTKGRTRRTTAVFGPLIGNKLLVRSGASPGDRLRFKQRGAAHD